MAQITLHDLAKKLNISVSTVSKALKDYPDVSEKTKKRVLALADKLNFSPNIVASNLRTRHTKTIGVIIPNIVHDFFSKVIGGIIDEADKNGYIVILLQSNEKYELEKKQLNLLIQQQVDGILLSLTAETKKFKHIKRLQQQGIPLVMFDKVTDSIECSKVIIGDKKSAFDAVSFLIRKGNKRIAYFGGSLVALNFSERFNGYIDALKEYRIPFEDRLVYMSDKNEQYSHGYIAAERMIKDHGINGIDAVFAATDVIAVGIIKYFNDNKINIPNKVAIFGFGNSFMSSIISPALSTIDQPGYEMGKKAVDILLTEILQKEKNENTGFQKVIIPTSLKIRQST